MTRKTAQFLLRLFLITLSWSCAATKEPHTYFICVKQDGVSGQVLKNENIGIADTTAALLIGNVSDLMSSEKLMYAAVSLKNSNTEKQYGQSTDSLGQFSIIAPAGSYTFRVFFVGYSEINLNVSLGTGEMREIGIALGQDAAYVTYKIDSRKKLNRIQLRKAGKELQKVQQPHLE